MRPSGLFNWLHAPCRSKKMLASPGRYGFGEMDTLVPAYGTTLRLAICRSPWLSRSPSRSDPPPLQPPDR